MPFDYRNTEQLHADDLRGLSAWHHEGIGTMEPLPGGGMRLRRSGSPPGGLGCNAFFRPTLPDGIAVEYELVVRSHAGLFINFLAMRGLKGEDLVADRGEMEPRDGRFPNYYGRKWGLQSYHVSISRFRGEGEHTGTSNWRRNPGLLLVGHGEDPVREIGRPYRIRLTKEAGHLQLFVDGRFAHGCMDRDAGRYPIPDSGKFGFRLIGLDLTVEIRAFRVFRAALDEAARAEVWGNKEDFGL
jgi:hypothetical protein